MGRSVLAPSLLRHAACVAARPKRNSAITPALGRVGQPLRALAKKIVAGLCYHRATTLRRTNQTQPNSAGAIPSENRHLLCSCVWLIWSRATYEPGGREFESLRARQNPLFGCRAIPLANTRVTTESPEESLRESSFLQIQRLQSYIRGEDSFANQSSAAPLTRLLGPGLTCAQIAVGCV